MLQHLMRLLRRLLGEPRVGYRDKLALNLFIRNLEQRRVLNADFAIVGMDMDGLELSNFGGTTNSLLIQDDPGGTEYNFVLDNGTWNGTDAAGVTGMNRPALAVDRTLVTSAIQIDAEPINITIGDLTASVSQQLNVTGTVQLNGSLALDMDSITPGDVLAGDTFAIVHTTSGVSGAFSNFADGDTVASNIHDGGFDLIIDYQANDVVLAAQTTVNLSVSRASGTEGGPAEMTEITVTAHASAAVRGTQTIDIAVSGTGITNDDFTLSDTQIQISDGLRSGSVTFIIQNDDLVETATETATLTISNPSAGLMLGSTRSQQITITDDDVATLQISAAFATVTETDSDQTVEYTVSLDKAVQGGLTIALLETGTDAEAADFSLPAAITFDDADTVDKKFNLTIKGDSIVEATETVIVSMSVSEAPTGAIITAVATASTAITNDDTSTITIAGASAGEAAGSMTFTATLVDAVEGGVHVDFTTDNGTAVAGTTGDFLASSGTLMFSGTSAGEQQTFAVSVLDDRRVEGTEFFTVALNNVTPQQDGLNPVSIAAMGAVATIDDNDTATITFDPAVSTRDEDYATQTITTKLTVNPRGDVGDVGLDRVVVVSVERTGGTALGVGSDADFSFNTQQVTFAVAQGSSFTDSNVTVQIFDDLLHDDTERDDGGSDNIETIELGFANLMDGSATQVTSSGMHTVTIMDDDSSTTTRYDVPEGGEYTLSINAESLLRITGPSETRIAPLPGGAIVINGTSEADTLTIDYSHAEATHFPEVLFDGLGGGDTLAFSNGTFSSADFTYTNATDGSVRFDDQGLITYQNLAPIVATSSIMVADVTLNYSSTTETIVVTNSGTSGQTTVLAQDTTMMATAETTTFTNPSNSLTINAGDTNSDTVDVVSLGDGFSAGVKINGQGGNSNTINWGTTQAVAAIELTAQTIHLTSGEMTTTDTQTYHGPVLLDADTTITAGGDVVFADTLQSGGNSHTLNLAGIGTKDFRGVVGIPAAGSEVSAITQDATSGDLTFREDVFVGTGGALFHEGVTLDGLTFDSAGTLSFGDAGTGVLTIANAPVTIDTSANNSTLTIQSVTALNADLSLDIGSNAASVIAGVLRGPAGLVKNGGGSVRLTGGNTYDGTTTINAGTLIVDGKIGENGVAGPVTVAGGATLSGGGDVNAPINVLAGGTIAPGNGLQILATNDITFDLGATLEVEIDGPLPGPHPGGHDQLATNGSVTFDDPTLSVSGTIEPLAGQQIVFVKNDGSDPVTGTFAGLAEGSTVTIHGTTFILSYVGGEGGNDTTLTQLGPVSYLSDGVGAGALELRLNGENVQFLDDGTVIDSRPLTSLLDQSILISGTDSQSETLLVNYAFGGFFDTDVVWHGGASAADNDALRVTGGTFATVTHTFTAVGPQHSGNVVYDLGNSATATITYDGLKPIDMSGSTIVDLVFNLPGTTDFGILEDDTGALTDVSQIRSQAVIPTFATTTFATPNSNLIVNLGNDDGTFTVARADSDNHASLTVSGQEGNDEINLTHSLRLGTSTSEGNVDFSAETINLSAAINTDMGSTAAGGNVTLTSRTIDLGADVAIDTDREMGSDGDVKIDGSLNADDADQNRDLTLTAGDGTIMLNDVGATRNLRAFTIASASHAWLQRVATRAGDVNVTSPDIRLNGNLTTGGHDAAGSVLLTGAVKLGGPVEIDTDAATTDGTISFSDTIDGDSTLLLRAGSADVTIGSNVGGDLALARVTIEGSQNVTFGGTLRTTGDVRQTFGMGTTTFNGTSASGVGGVLDIASNTIHFTSAKFTTVGAVNLDAQDAVTLNVGLDAGASTIAIKANQDESGIQEFSQTAGTIITANESADAVKIAVGGMGNANIYQIASGTITGRVSITAGGEILRDAAAAADSIAANAALLIGPGGIGTAANAIKTSVDTLDFAEATAGGASAASGVFVINSHGLTLQDLNAATATARGGQVTAAGPLSVNMDIDVTGSIIFTAANDLTANSGKTVRSTNGDVLLRAGGDITLQNSSTVEATIGRVTIEGDFNDTNGGVGTTITVQGTIASLLQAEIKGGRDSDVFIIDPRETHTVSAARLDGAGGADRYNVQFGNLTGDISVEDSGTDGADELNIRGTTNDDTLTVDATDTVLTSPAQTVKYNNDLETLYVDGDAGSDTFRLTPAVNTMINIKGGEPPASTSPGDALNFTTPSGEAATITQADFSKGTIQSSGSYQAVNFDKTETIGLQGVVIVAGTGNDDTLELTATSRDAASYALATNGVAGPTVNLTDVRSFVFQGLAGDDQFILTHAASNVFAPLGGILFAGQATANDVANNPPGDSLTINGPSGALLDVVSHRFDAASVPPNGDDGVILLEDVALSLSAGNPFIAYTGLTQIVDNINAAAREFILTAGPETVTLSDDTTSTDNATAGRSRIERSPGELINFVNPAASLRLDTTASSSANLISVEGLDAAYDADLTIVGDGDDTLTWQNGPTDLGTGNLDATAGTVNVNAKVTTSGNAKLKALAANITDGNGAGVNIEASELTAEAVTGIDLDSHVSKINATVSNAGSITIDETGVVELVHVETANGPIIISAGGQLTATDVQSATDNDANDILLSTSSGDILVGLVSAGATAGDVLISAAGSIEEAAADSDTDIVADEWESVAATGIGGGNTIEIDASKVAVSTARGAVRLHDRSGGLTLTDVNVDGLGPATSGVSITAGNAPDEIEISASHELTVEAVVSNTGGGNITILAAGPLAVNHAVTNVDGGNIDLTATVDAAGTNQGLLSIAAEVTVTGGPGRIRLTGEDVDVNRPLQTAGGLIEILADKDIQFGVQGDVTTGGGNVRVLATAGGSTMADAGGDTAMIDAGTGEIAIEAVNDIRLGRVVTTSSAADAVAIRSTSGNVLDNGDSLGPDIDAANGKVSITANRVGTDGVIDNAIETKGAELNVDTTASSGNQLVSEFDGLNELNLNAGGGSVWLTAGGTILDGDAATDIRANSVTLTTTAGNIGQLGSSVFVTAMNPLETEAGMLEIATDAAGSTAAIANSTLGGLTVVNVRPGLGVAASALITNNSSIDVVAHTLTADDNLGLVSTAGSINLPAGGTNVAGGDLRIEAANDGQDVSSGDATNLVAHEFTAGSLAFSSGTGENLTTNVIRLTAHITGSTDGGAGKLSVLEKDAITLVDVDTVNGAIDVQANGTLEASRVESGGGAGNGVSLRTTAGGINIGTVTSADFAVVSADAGDVTVNGLVAATSVTVAAVGGSIGDHTDDALADITSTSSALIMLTAAGDVSGPGADGYLDLAAGSQVDASSVVAGEVFLRSLGAITLVNIVTTDGPVDVEAAGRIDARQVASGGGVGDGVRLHTTAGGVVIAESTLRSADSALIDADQGNILVAEITAVTTVDLNADAGSVVDSSDDAAVDVTSTSGSLITLTASGNINGVTGTDGRLELAPGSQVSVSSTDAGEIVLRGLGALTLVDVHSVGSKINVLSDGGMTINNLETDSDVDLTASTGNLQIDSVATSDVGTVIVTATAGAIQEFGSDPLADVTGGSLVFNSALGLGATDTSASLETDATIINAVNTTSGGIFLNAVGVGGTAITAQAQTAGDIEITSDTEPVTLVDLDSFGGNIKATVNDFDVTARNLSAGARGTIDLATIHAGNLVVGGVRALEGDVVLRAAGRILAVDPGLDIDPGISAATLVAVAGAGVGSAETPIVTRLDGPEGRDGTLEGDSGSGGFFVVNAGTSLTIGDLENLSSVDGITAGDDIDLQTTGNLTINKNIATDGQDSTIIGRFVGTVAVRDGVVIATRTGRISEVEKQLDTDVIVKAREFSPGSMVQVNADRVAMIEVQLLDPVLDIGEKNFRITVDWGLAGTPATAVKSLSGSEPLTAEALSRVQFHPPDRNDLILLDGIALENPPPFDAAVRYDGNNLVDSSTENDVYVFGRQFELAAILDRSSPLAPNAVTVSIDYDAHEMVDSSGNVTLNENGIQFFNGDSPVRPTATVILNFSAQTIGQPRPSADPAPALPFVPAETAVLPPDGNTIVLIATQLEPVKAGQRAEREAVRSVELKRLELDGTETLVVPGRPITEEELNSRDALLLRISKDRSLRDGVYRLYLKEGESEQLILEFSKFRGAIGDPVTESPRESNPASQETNADDSNEPANSDNPAGTQAEELPPPAVSHQSDRGAASLAAIDQQHPHVASYSRAARLARRIQG